MSKKLFGKKSLKSRDTPIFKNKFSGKILTNSDNPFIIKSSKHYIMKSYKKLFREEGFTFNGKLYGDKSFTMNYYNLVKDILDGVHGKTPPPTTLSKMFMSTVSLDYNSLPSSVKERKLYKELGDIYVLTNKDIKGFSSSISRISKYMDVSVIYHSYL